MKKLFSTLLVVVFLISSLSLTGLAADDYTEQYLGDGFTRLTLTDTAFAAGTERSFTVNIQEDGEYAVFIANPDKKTSAITATFTKDGETKTASKAVATEEYTYVRIGSGSPLSSVALTEGEWTLSVKAGAARTVPYIDIRSTVINVDGGKQAIYPMDANSISTTQTLGKSINEPTGTNYAKAPSGYTYYGNLENSALEVTRTAPGAVIVTSGNTATYKINVETAGEYKIIGYGKLRAGATDTTSDNTVNAVMTVGSTTVSESATIVKGSGENQWSVDFISLVATVELEAGVNNIIFTNPNPTSGVNAKWYLNYITIEEKEEDPPYVLVSDKVAGYTEAALAAYNTDEYADYSKTLVTSYAATGNDYSKPVTLSWDAVDGAESYDLYVSTSQTYADDETYVTEGIEATTYDVINLWTGKTYYWKAVSGETVASSGKFKTASMPRFLTVEGVNNVRDIGGWNGLNQGMAYRGTELNLVENNGFALTEEGLRVMRDDLGIKTDLDLRATTITESPIGSDVNFIKVYIGNYVNAFSETTSYAKILATFADIDNYPIYFHCMGGADRTGTVGAIVEALAGADEAELSIDYELTSFSKLGTRNRNSTTYNYKGLIAGLKAYDGDTLQEKTENYATKTLGLTRAQVSNIQSLMGGNMVVFADTAPVEVKEGTTITLANLGTNTVTGVSFKGESIPYTMDGNVITVDLETLGLGEITFADGNVLKFEANSVLDITFDDIANGQANDFVTKNLTLPEKYTWTSSNPAVVSTTGVVTRPEFKNAMIELTASNEKGSKSINFTVKAKTSESYNQSYFIDSALMESETDTAVLGTVGGNDSLIDGWYVGNADVTSSTVTADNILSVDMNSKSSKFTQVHVDLDEPADETIVIEFDILADYPDDVTSYVYLNAKVKSPAGDVQNVNLLKFDGNSDCVRSAIPWDRLDKLGGTDIAGIRGNKKNIKVELNPVKMTARYAGMNSGNNWNAYTTSYADLLNVRYKIDGVNITDLSKLSDVNYEIIGFYFEAQSTSAPTINIDSFKVYAERDCAVADMSVEVSGSSADVAVELTDAYTGVVIVALYDETGKLAGVKMVNLSAESSFEETITFTSAPVRASVFFLEDMTTIKPLETNVPLNNTALEWKN